MVSAQWPRHATAAVIFLLVGARAVMDPNPLLDKDLDAKCHKVLSSAWKAFDRKPCSESMHEKLSRLEATETRCRELDWGEEFDNSHAELRKKVRMSCGENSAPKLKRLQEKSKAKFQRIAAEEQRDCSRKGGSNETGAAEVTCEELLNDVLRVKDGKMSGEEDLEAVQTVMATQDLNSTKPKSEGGEGAPVVTMEDIQQVTAESLNEDPEDLVLVESMPNDAGPDHTFVEGDMRVPKKTKKSLLGIRQGLHVHLRGFHPKIAAGYQWPGGEVPYCFASDITHAAKRAFLEALHHYENMPISQCLKFREIDASSEHCAERHAVFVMSREARSCWSDLGYMGIYGRPNQLNLGTGCEVKGIAVHEFGHALGMDHEQSRPDRDKYIKIVYENVRDGLADQFNINSEAYTQREYDFYSIMHYGRTTFSKDKSSQTIVLAEGVAGTNDVLGQAMGLSELDILQLGDMYCPDVDMSAKAKSSSSRGRSRSAGARTSTSAFVIGGVSLLTWVLL